MSERNHFVASRYTESEYPVDGPDADDMGLEGWCNACDEPVEKGADHADPHHIGEILCEQCASEIGGV